MNLAVVLVATCGAIGVLGLLLNELNAWAAHVNRFAPYALVVAVVLIAAAMHLLAPRALREWRGRLKRFRGRSAAGFLDRPQDFFAGSHALFGFQPF